MSETDDKASQIDDLVMCETETIDKLYLELSQFTKAKTKNSEGR